MNMNTFVAPKGNYVWEIIPSPILYEHFVVRIHLPNAQTGYLAMAYDQLNVIWLVKVKVTNSWNECIHWKVEAALPAG